jgi:hypothetical protein
MRHIIYMTVLNDIARQNSLKLFCSKYTDCFGIAFLREPQSYELSVFPSSSRPREYCPIY